MLEEKLRRADAFAVMLPRDAYMDVEIDLVERFVEKGGKLLLVSDPTRPNRINVLAKRFGVEFQPDYLYNTVEYDLNFRNIFVRDFQPDPLTNGLDAIAMYIAGSVRSSGNGLVFTDANTRSSLAEADQRFQPIAWGDSRNVLAIADFTFMVPPYNSLLDNDRLLSNLADYLTDSQREFDLDRFPALLRGPSGRRHRHPAGAAIPLGYRGADEKRPRVFRADLGHQRSGGREPGHCVPGVVRERPGREPIPPGRGHTDRRRSEHPVRA